MRPARNVDTVQETTGRLANRAPASSLGDEALCVRPGQASSLLRGFPQNQAGRRRAEPRVGYLVANPHQQNPTPLSQIWAFAQWNRTYAFAQELQKRFGVKHTLLGPPHLAALPEEQATRLNFNLTYFPASFRRKVRGGPSVTYPPSYAPGKEVTVQAVRACPWPSCIIVGCDMEKLSR